MPMDPGRHVADFRLEAGRCAALARALPHAAPIPHVPRWSVGGVIQHLVGDFRWATHIIEERAWNGKGFSVARTKGERLLAAYDAAAAAMADALSTAASEPTTSCPNFADRDDGRLGWWPRHQAHETLLHRWDLESSTGAHDPIDAEVAADAIDEALIVYTARYAPHRLDQAITLACTDADAAWTVVPSDAPGRVDVHRGIAGATPDLSCRAEDLLLAMWKRRSLDQAEGGSGMESATVRAFFRGPLTA